MSTVYTGANVEVVGIYLKIKMALVSNRTQISHAYRSKTGNFGFLYFFIKVILILY
jgi:hypothetical protein